MIWSMMLLSFIAFSNGDFEKASALREEFAKLASEYNLLSGVKTALALAGMLDAIAGDYESSRQHCEEALAMPIVGIDAAPGLMANFALAVRAYILGDANTAREHYRKAYPHVFTSNFSSLLAAAALIHSLDDEKEKAVEALASAFHYFCGTGWLHKWTLLTDLRANLEKELGAEKFQAAWERGKQRDANTVAKELMPEKE
jgi:tetratricopeptide (TPR) repeat protein